MKKDLSYYMNLNYPIEIVKIPDKDGGGFQATIPLLGKYAFLGDGETYEEAITELSITKEYLFNKYLEQGIPIPEPAEEEHKDYSGRFVLRIPAELHYFLSTEARKNGSTLNQYCNYILTRKSYLNSIQEEIKSLSSEIRDVFSKIKEINYKISNSTLKQNVRCLESDINDPYNKCA